MDAKINKRLFDSMLTRYETQNEDINIFKENILTDQNNLILGIGDTTLQEYYRGGSKLQK